MFCRKSTSKDRGIKEENIRRQQNKNTCVYVCHSAYVCLRVCVCVSLSLSVSLSLFLSLSVFVCVCMFVRLRVCEIKKEILFDQCLTSLLTRRISLWLRFVEVS